MDFPVDNDNGGSIPLTGTEKKKKVWCSIGSVMNYTIGFIFLAIFVTCLIVIGTIGTLQSNLTDYKDPSNNTNDSGRACYMFSRCNGEPLVNKSKCHFKPDRNSECDGTMVGYALIAFVSLAFFLLAIFKAVINHTLNWSLYIEIPTIAILLLIEFSLSVLISVGNLVTCHSIKDFYNSKTCSRSFPYVGFQYNSLATTAMNSSWFIFLFLFIVLVIYVIRLVIFLRRKKKERVLSAIEKENFDNSGNKDPAVM